MNDPTLHPLVSDDELHALVDGRLAPAAQAALQARIDADPRAAETLAAWQRQRQALRMLHATLDEEPAPPLLLQAARQATAAREQAARWRRWGGMAASVLLAFGLGWMGHARLALTGATDGVAGGALQAREFARQAAVAHAVYSPEVRHPVEVAAAQQEHLVQWLSKRLGRPLKVPTLAAQGYELVGGRLLPGDDGARAQFMFQNAAGLRVTLYVGAMTGPGAQAAARETAFNFSSDGPVPGFYWVDQGFGYALAGKLSRAELLQLAEVVYRQL